MFETCPLRSLDSRRDLSCVKGMASRRQCDFATVEVEQFKLESANVVNPIYISRQKREVAVNGLDANVSYEI